MVEGRSPRQLEANGRGRMDMMIMMKIFLEIEGTYIKILTHYYAQYILRLLFITKITSKFQPHLTHIFLYQPIRVLFWSYHEFLRTFSGCETKNNGLVRIPTNDRLRLNYPFHFSSKYYT